MEVPARVPGASTLEAELVDLAAIKILPAAKWVADRLDGRPVLDASSATGVAARLFISRGFETVCLVDSASKAHVLAGELGSHAVVHHSALTKVPHPAGWFGAVLCKAVDLAQDSIDAVFSEMQRLLSDDGILVIIGGPESSEDHLNPGLSLRELESALSRRFSHSVVVSQTDLLISTVGGKDSIPEPPIPHASGHTRKAAFVAASNRADNLGGSAAVFVNPIDLDILVDNWELTAKRCLVAQGQASAAERAAAGKERLVEELYMAEQALAEAFDIRKRLESVVDNAADIQRRLGPELAAAQAEIARLNEWAHAEITALRTSTSWRVTKPLRMLSGLLRSPSGDS